MQSFTFHNPTRILFGRGQIAKISREIPAAARVMLTFGGGSIRQNGVYDQIQAALKDREVVEFGGIEPNPTFETLMKAVDKARQERVDFLLAAGGGSVVDGTKFIAAAVPFDGDPWDLCLRHTPPASALPLGAVLTLPATGSESNGYAVITRKSTLEKLSFGHPSLFPCFAVLDPEATFSLPPRQVANGVVDAFVHVMEQYLTYPAEAPLQDRLAESILQTLIEVGPRTLAEPQDYEARASLMWCANLALNGLIGAGVPQDWSTHALGHELTALHGIDHGRTLAILLPNLLWVQREGKRAKLLQFAERVWGLREGSEGVRVEGGIVRTREFFESLGVSTHLEDYNPDRDRAEEIVARLERRGVLPLGERKDLDAAKVREILLLCR